MTEATAGTTGRPVWVDLSSADPAGSRAFYAALFGWEVEVSPDPRYGGYAMAKVGGKDVAGIGPAQPGAPTAWALYLGTPDAEGLGRRVAAAGGTVVMPAFAVGDIGRMAVFQDPTGAFISAWQPNPMPANAMPGFGGGGPGTYGWAELNARGLDRATPFYEAVFGWTHRTSDIGNGQQYTEFQARGESIAGAMEMNPMVPGEVPSYWMVYFAVDDVDASFAKALDAGAREMLAPGDFPGGRFAIVGDPQGAVFGLLKMAAQ